MIDTRAVVASAIGNSLEWYDFEVFGFFAPVIATQFFPSEDAIAGLINTLGCSPPGTWYGPSAASCLALSATGWGASAP
jgi:MFS transporter, MHS family, proline/betaine transporter